MHIYMHSYILIIWSKIKNKNNSKNFPKYTVRSHYYKYSKQLKKRVDEKCMTHKKINVISISNT